MKNQPIKDLSDVMTYDVEIIQPDASISEASRRMMERNVGAIPVCHDGRLVGMITDRDIVVRVVSANLDPAKTSVGEAMTSPVVYCFDDQKVTEVSALMQRYHVRRLAVLNRDKKLIGILSISDLAIEPRNERLVGELLQAIYDTSLAAAA